LAVKPAPRSIVKPFLRWAGGKQWLARTLLPLVPNNGGTYYEPFLGGGSLFFALQPKKAVLGDVNGRLIETYKVVRDHPDELIHILSEWENDERTFYAIRASAFEDEPSRAAQVIYLNKTCWNGLYRVNRQGAFNVPFGYNGRTVFSPENLLEASAALQNASIVNGDFDQLLGTAIAGDFVYLDPPYTVLHSRNGFRQYNEKLFSWQDQVRLASTAQVLARLGCLVVVSNADNGGVVALYDGFFRQTLTRHSILSADPRARRKTDEALLVSSDQLLLAELEAERITANEHEHGHLGSGVSPSG
jgi:DNA adenine methylase